MIENNVTNKVATIVIKMNFTLLYLKLRSDRLMPDNHVG